jgi:hypothetical protein
LEAKLYIFLTYILNDMSGSLSSHTGQEMPIKYIMRHSGESAAKHQLETVPWVHVPANLHPGKEPAASTGEEGG